MMSIFLDMVKDTIKVFMDDFYLISYSFEYFLDPLGVMLHIFEEFNIVLN